MTFVNERLHSLQTVGSSSAEEKMIEGLSSIQIIYIYM